jgi:hypothetical protein
MSLLYRRGRARPRPWPFSMVLDGLRVMLLGQDKQDTQMVSQKPPDQSNVVPTDFGEDARSPLYGKYTTWDTLHMGFGQKIEPRRGMGLPTGRYRYAVGADCSVSGRPAMPGPDIVTFVPTVRDTANPVNRFCEMDGKLYWANGRYLVRRDTDAATTAVADFGVGQVVRDVICWGTNTTTATNMYFAMGETVPIWRFDGTTTTQHATLTATAFVGIGRDLLRAQGVNQVSKVDTNSDPWMAANWTSPNTYYVGDRSSPITRLTMLSEGATGSGGTDYLVVVKTDGLYSVTTAGEDVQYFSQMKAALRADNGEALGHFGNDLYVRMGESLWRITPQMEGDEIGPEQYGTLDPLLQGRITAFAGHGSFHAYAGLYNHVDNVSYLLKYGAYVEDERGQVQRLPAWHGSISQALAGKRVTALYKSQAGAPANHHRLYLGFSDGTIGWFTLPCVPDPAACDQYHWSTTEGYVVLSDTHVGFRGNEKLLLNVTVGGERLSGNAYARVAYAVDGEPLLDLPGSFDQTPRETIAFPQDTNATVVGLRLYIRSLLNTTTCLLSSVALRWRLQTPLQQVYQWIVAAHDEMVTRDGTPLRYGARRIREIVRTAVDTSRSVVVILPDEGQKLMSLIDIREKTGWDATRGGRWRAGLQVTAVEEETLGAYGTYGRLDTLIYGDLDSMTYGDLETI